MIVEKILIIDDSIVQAAQLKAILEDDYEVSVAQTAEEGQRCIDREDYSLILLDVVMPEVDGFTLLERLQKEVATRSVPVILITSLSDVVYEQQGLMLGAVDYITKPLNPVIVKARVNTHIKLYDLRRQVEQQSMIDPITQVANRRCYEQYSVSMWQEAGRLRLPFSVCMFDIDHFKAYNDTFGHPAGDQVLSAVARTVSSRLHRATDFFARYGGEEFVAISLGDDANKVFRYMKGIRQAVEDLHIPHDPSVGGWITVSMGGVTVIPETEHHYGTYLKIADTMLYDAKHHGRNRVVWADEGMRQLLEKQ